MIGVLSGISDPETPIFPVQVRGGLVTHKVVKSNGLQSTLCPLIGI